MLRIAFHSAKMRCRQKVDYRSQKKAEAAIAKQAALGRVRYAYNCPHCGGWHLTKMSPAERAKLPRFVIRIPLNWLKRLLWLK